MKVKGSCNPPLFDVEKIGNKALLRFYENVEEVTEQGETPVVCWEYDRYTIERLYDDGLVGRVENDLPAWLTLAKSEEYARLAAEVRARRNQLLADTDKTQLSDAPMTRDAKADYKVYRQALRDMPLQDEFPYNVAFPVMPDVA